MITATLSKDKNWLHIESLDIREVEAIRVAFNKRIPNWYIIQKKNPYINIEESFMNQYNLIPAGLWVELLNAAKSISVDVSFSEDFIPETQDVNITREEVGEYIGKLYEHSTMTPMEYQIDAVYSILKYKKGCIEISTSGGKTFISYMLFRYMYDVLGVKHILFVTPSTNLTTQSADKWVKYDEENGIETTWTHTEIHSKAKKKEAYDETIVFGNYQSLKNKDIDFFKMFDVVIVDECHHTKGKSIRSITSRCVNAQYKIGMTGTFPSDGEYDSFLIQSYIGPIIYRLSSDALINKEHFATPVHVKLCELRYLEDDELELLHYKRANKQTNDPNAGMALYNEESSIVRSNRKRFRFVCDMIGKTTKNTLAIFSDIKTGYGQKIYNYLKDHTMKHVFYIDGDTPYAQRDQIKEYMEEDTDGNTIIVASLGCFSEGIDVCNLWNIFLLESTKSDINVAQLLGRGMRRFEGKDKTTMIDFVDDFRFGTDKYSENYLYKHGKERQAIYTKRGFPLEIITVDFKTLALF